MKLSLDLLERSEQQYDPAPEEIRKIRERIKKEPVLKLDGAEHVRLRKEMIANVATEDVLDAQERYVGDNDLLPINYLLTGHLQSRSVGRVKYFDVGEGKVAYATGFLISECLLMTNHHVFPVDDEAAFRGFAEDAVVEFNHEFDIDGQRAVPLTFRLDPAAFFHSNKQLDVAIIGVAATDVAGQRPLADQGYLVLNGGLGKAGLGDFATIIQHPGGREKQIALRNNQIIKRDLPDVLIYVSDTAEGSSGGAVFNNEWQVIALHSSGVAKKNAKGQYVDKNDQVIEPVNGKVDGDRVVWTSNSGTRVSSIMEHLKAASSHPLIQDLFAPAYTDSRPYAHLSRPAMGGERMMIAPAAAPMVPAPTQPLAIHISIGATGMPALTIHGATAAAPASPSVFEKKLEDEMDFSSCAGFDEDFMGVDIPMPLPTAALRKKLAFQLENPGSYLLKYHHFSTIHHAVRRVPVVSAINVSGKYRYAALGKGTRQDNWYRDNRIDQDVPLNDDFYAKSGFDKGHLGRREDAEWGTTLERAKLAADMTCSYANAVPQVPALNRNIFGYHGLWGALEGKLLEQGVGLESGKSGRICLFAGPLFQEDDPVFKGVQVALDFFKVAVWYDAGGKLRTTCFRLSQEDLVGEVAFEVLKFDKVFKSYQCPIDEIEKATGLRFHKNITDNDTYAGAAGGEVLTERALDRLVAPLRADALN